MPLIIEISANYKQWFATGNTLNSTNTCLTMWYMPEYEGVSVDEMRKMRNAGRGNVTDVHQPN